jgi:hypothetical protein
MNDEMAMSQRGGTKGKPIVERMLNVFDLHFSTTAEKAMSRIYASKTERNLQIFGWFLQFKQSCPWATLSYFCLQNKAGKINAMIQKSSALSIHLKEEKSLCKLNSLHLPPKNHNLVVKLGSKRELEKKEFAATGL